MYDVPVVNHHTNAFWQAIAAELAKAGVSAPSKLTRDVDDWTVWQHPELLFSQTCGFPFVSKLEGHVTLIGTPDYGAVSRRPGWYNSKVICRADDPRDTLAAFKGATFAYNDMASQSGVMSIMYLLHRTIGDERHFGTCEQSGGHAFSTAMVAQGEADIAAVDSVTWMNIQRDQPDLNVRILAETDPTPGLPYITHKDQEAAVFADAVEAAIAGLGQVTKDALHLRGFWRSNPSDYALIRERVVAATPVIQAHFSGHQPLAD
jgi:ABC-type phosphate/phosphonate transport system substrate-binding protein